MCLCVQGKGISAMDVKKLMDAGYNTVESVAYATRRVIFSCVLPHSVRSYVCCVCGVVCVCVVLCVCVWRCVWRCVCVVCVFVHYVTICLLWFQRAQSLTSIKGISEPKADRLLTEGTRVVGEPPHRHMHTLTRTTHLL